MPLIILDRDGVINYESDNFIKSPDEWKPLPGSLEAIARLNHAGYRVVVASNQSGIGRGLFDIDTLNAIHDKMRSELAAIGGSIEAIFFCPHHPDDGCACRKPRPGLMLDLAERLGIHLTGVPAVGDSLRDIQATRVAGASPVLVRTGHGSVTESNGEDIEGIAVYDDLAQFTEKLLSRPNVQ